MTNSPEREHARPAKVIGKDTAAVFTGEDYIAFGEALTIVDEELVLQREIRIVLEESVSITDQLYGKSVNRQLADQVGYHETVAAQLAGKIVPATQRVSHLSTLTITSTFGQGGFGQGGFGGTLDVPG